MSQPLRQEAPVIDEEERTTAAGLARYAFDYIEAAMVVDQHSQRVDPDNQISPMPAYYMAMLGIELTFKAYLRHVGLSVKDLRKIGHDLYSLREASRERGLYAIFREQATDEVALEMLVALNGNAHEMRYIRTGLKSFPYWSVVEPLAVRMHQAVAPYVGYRSFTKSYAAADAWPR